MAKRWLSLILPLVTLLASPPARAEWRPAHPLDGLGSAEHWVVLEALRASGRLADDAVFVTVLLNEPPKPEVLAWRPGKPFRREALAVIRQQQGAYEATVDLINKKVIAWRHIPGAHTMFTESDYADAGELMLDHPAVLAALRRRGIDDISTVGCWGYAPGVRPPGIAPERRIARGICADRRGVHNAIGRRIEGLDVLLDLDEQRVLHVHDVGPTVRSTAPTDFDAESLAPFASPMPPIEVRQPNGVGYRLDGNVVSWHDWRFHVRVDPRRGLVLSTIGIEDEGRRRSVLYQASLSEMYVPYMDTAPMWADRLYLDLGEYVSDGLAEALESGVDCPVGAMYFDDVIATESGQPKRRRRVACLFERPAPMPVWRHGVENTTRVDGRVGRELVVRMVATIGNYDYVFDWVFQQNGALRVIVGATGVLEVKTVESKRVAVGQHDGPSARADETYGHLVAEHLVAVNHDHYFAFRLDFDVDGTDNSFIESRLVRRRLPDTSTRRSLWVIEEQVATSERAARFPSQPHEPSRWRVVSGSRRNAVGQRTGYEVLGHGAASLLAPDDPAQTRAGFTAHPLWITAYDREQLYAAGAYPTLGAGGDGLPRWSARDRPLENKDLVVWYTVGFHHVPRSEDWPVMPTMSHEFEIRPFDFFSRNPALRLPP